ncbi:MAG: tetratricopeptide repeat protein [Gemmatimonadetes bacterium]|nr:tetratricopeptide repeat protein [Gemmatimonadota bacterium]
MDQPRDAVLSALVKSWLPLPLALTALLGASPLVVHAQAQGAADRCYPSSQQSSASSASSAVERVLTLATADLDSGRVFQAIDRLERASGATDARLLPLLARAYAKAGCRAAFIATAERALATNPAPAEAAALRAMLSVARAEVVDSVATSSLAVAPDDSVREGVLYNLAWTQYRAGQFIPAATAFDQVAAAAPGVQARLEARTMAAQATLEARRNGEAAARFRVVADSLHALQGLLAQRSADSSAERFARALADRQATSLLWAPEIREGRLLVPTGDLVGTLRRVQAGDVSRRIDALGPAGADTVLRALVWTAAPGGLTALRAVADSLALVDVHVARAVARIDALAADRSVRIADAARYKALVATVADSFAVTERQLRGFADSLARHDTAIARTIAEYRQTLLGKIAAVRDAATQNRAAIDSIAEPLKRFGAGAMQVVALEQQTASAYMGTAESAASALDVGLTRLPIVFQRDSVRAKFVALQKSLAAARTMYDSAFAAASLAEQNAAGDADRRLAEARAEKSAAESERDALVARTATAAAAVLRARVDSLRASLDRSAEGAEYGLGAALYFVALEADSTHAANVDETRTRDAAISALTAVLARQPKSPLRARALLELGELLARKADAEYAAAQRAGGSGDHADYTAAMGRFDELLRDFPQDSEADAAAYTLGSLAYLSQKYDDAVKAFERILPMEQSRYRAEAYFKHGDAKFELATKGSGDARRALLAQAAQSYEKAIALSPKDGDIYYLALYKLGWSDYVQAERQSSDEYRRAVDNFARLVREMDQLAPERQARLALRQEAVDYLAIAITQLGGAEEAVRFLGTIPDPVTRLLVLRRVARALAGQGEFANAVLAYRAAADQAPTDPSLLETRLEMVDLFQNRMLEPGRAQEARLILAETLAPSSAWGRANAARAAEAAKVREKAMRESGSYALAEARKLQGRPQAAAAYGNAADLLGRYLSEFSKSDSAQRVSAFEGDALFAAGDYANAGSSFNRTATKWTTDPTLAANARRNAIVAFDSALAVEARRPAAGEAPAVRATRARALQDSLFAATARFVAQSSDADARGALIAQGRRAAEGGRWDVVATTFQGFSTRFPGDPFAPDARKAVGDAFYRQGRYADAQREWLAAQQAAVAAGRKALTDSIVSVRLAAASQAADSLTKLGRYTAAADSIFGAIAADIGDPTRAADAMRNAIEVHLQADSLARAKGATATTDFDRATTADASKRERESAIAAIERLAASYPAYQYTLTYSALRTKLLSDVGRPAEAIAGLQALIAEHPTWPGRADGMVRVAVLLDSLGKRADAAAAYEKFSLAYPNDKRAADAQYNAALGWADAKDAPAASKAFAQFAQRFPRDPRAAEAMRARVLQLQAAGDTAAVAGELTRLCANPGNALASLCADRKGSAAFRDGMAKWDRYVALKLEIPRKSQLTKLGVENASEAKIIALRSITRDFARAIASGSPEWIAAGSFQTALAQWQYGLFLRDVVLPADITDAQREGAKRGSAQQAQGYFDAAMKLWGALVEKASAEKIENEWVDRAKAALRGEGIPPREALP